MEKKKIFKEGVYEAKIEGITEDEMNNFLIDMFAPKKEVNPNDGITPAAGNPVTIILTKKNYSSYFELNEQNN